MSDFVLRMKDGWVEISDLVKEMNPNVQKELWDYLALYAPEDAMATLEIEIGDLLQDKIGQREIEGITGFLVPDAILGESFRVWVKVKQRKS